MAHKNRKKLNFIFGSAASSLLRAEGFSCSMEVLWGALWISKLKFKKKIFFTRFLSQFVVIKTPWIRIHLKWWIQIHNTGFYDLVILCCRRNGGNAHFSLPFWSWGKVLIWSEHPDPEKESINTDFYTYTYFSFLHNIYLKYKTS